MLLKNQPVAAVHAPVVRPILALCMTVVLGAPLVSTQAADHLEAPALVGRGDVDLNDLYVFQSPGNANNSVLALTVNPFAGSISGSEFSSTASYEFVIDNDGDSLADVIFSTTFAAASGGVQALTTTRTEGLTTTPYAMGLTGQNITTADNGTGAGLLRADLFDDPFFFDLTGFQNGFAFTGTDAFAGANVSAIVLELPSSELEGLGNDIGVWARTVDANGQIDRVGRPAINTALIPSGLKDAFNQGEPADDVAAFSNEVIDSLMALGGDPALAGVLLPDILTFNTTNAAGFLNGRQLPDDVIDAVLGLVSGGNVITDLVGANDVAFPGLFPFLAAPHNNVAAPEPSTLMLGLVGAIGLAAFRRRKKSLGFDYVR